MKIPACNKKSRLVKEGEKKHSQKLKTGSIDCTRCIYHNAYTIQRVSTNNINPNSCNPKLETQRKSNNKFSKTTSRKTKGRDESKLVSAIQVVTLTTVQVGFHSSQNNQGKAITSSQAYRAVKSTHTHTKRHKTFFHSTWTRTISNGK